MGGGGDAGRRPTVNVFGAGIAGLTVAHELAERGFVVRVIEQDTCLDRHGRRRIAMGGVARTQYAIGRRARAGGAEGPWHARFCRSDVEGMNAVAEARDLRLVPIHVPFARGSREAPGGEARADVEGRVRALLDFLRGKDVDFRLEITGYADAHDDAPPPGPGSRPLTNPEEHRELCVERAEAARALIAGAAGEAACTIAAGGQGERAPRRSDGGAPDHNRWAVIEVCFTVLPGEHGFRFFPSYYNHVFDTMRRIPLLDGDGNESGRTVYDNVVPTPNQGIVSGGLSPLIMPRSPPGSDHERAERLAVLRTMGYAAADLTQMMLRVLRYMCTSSGRRALEMERVSWWEYLEGYDPATGDRLYHYSERFERDVKTQSRVLASFDALWGDARTCGNTYVQLFFNWIRALPKVDGTLSGPTSEVWLEPWRAYLERRLGVQFIPGGLERLELEDGEIVPRGFLIRLATGERPEGGELTPRERELAEAIRSADYHVVATDACSAEAITEPLRRAGVAAGVPRDLGGYTTKVRPAPPEEGEGAPRPAAGAGHAFGVEAWDRFQTMSGIQFFFTQELKINNGYVYYSQAPWGLTSINSAQFWRRRPTLERDGFVSLLSIDLCDWNTRAREGAAAGKTAAECGPVEIAEQVFAQIVAEMRPAGATAEAPIYDPPAPAWFYLDELLDFDERGVFTRARVPYLVPIKADFHHRPGPPPWDPTPRVVSPPPARALDPALWQAPHGGYLVHWGKLVFAGVYLKTFTRMSTMEAANESGRHAVNAILDHLRLVKAPAAPGAAAGAPAPPGAGAPAMPGVPAGAPAPAPGGGYAGAAPQAARHMRSEVFYRSTPAGDYCAIWDMEHWELPEFALAKQYDAWCLERGLPHPWDLLGIERIPSLVSKLAHAAGAQAGAGAAGADGASLDALLERTLRMAYPWGGADAVLEMLRGIRKAVEEGVKQAGR
ncbi:NAD(P)-binding protein [Sorangium sp. So ce134]